MLLLVLGVSVLLSVIFFIHYDDVLMKGIDTKLLTAARFTRDLLPPGYHGSIRDAHSVSKKEYLTIVDRYNRICRELGLEYIWSLILIDGEIRFTSGTSTSKDVSKGDHASFFQLHNKPEAYHKTFREMKVSYQVNDDRWGRIRIVLVPFRDMRGRKYLLGASMKVTDVSSILSQHQKMILLMVLLVSAVAVVAALFFARSISGPLAVIVSHAQMIANGDYRHSIDGRGQ